MPGSAIQQADYPGAESGVWDTRMQFMHRKMLKKTRTAQCLRVREEKWNRLGPGRHTGNQVEEHSQPSQIQSHKYALSLCLGTGSALILVHDHHTEPIALKEIQFPCLFSNEGITSRSDPAASRNFPARLGPKSRQSSSTTNRKFLRIRNCQHQAFAWNCSRSLWGHKCIAFFGFKTANISFGLRRLCCVTL